MIKDYRTMRSVLVNGILLGYICRRSHIYGYNDMIPNGFIVARGPSFDKWEGNFKSRKKAKEYILNFNYIEKNNEID